MSELSEKVINKLLERNSDLEFEVERLQLIIDKALDYVLTTKYSDYIDIKAFIQELYIILKDEKKNKEKK